MEGSGTAAYMVVSRSRPYFSLHFYKLTSSLGRNFLDVHGEWRVKINVGVSSGIMHIRKKTVERCEVEYVVAEEVIPMVSSYI